MVQQGMALQNVEHGIDVEASAEEVYRLISQVENWPQLFPPTVYAEQIEMTGSQERIRIWATANGSIKQWTSRRLFDPEGLRIDFRQEVSSPPVASMGGTWMIEPTGDRSCRIRLQHWYSALDDDPASLQWIDEAVDRNSRSELGVLKTTLERAADERSGRMLLFEDSLEIVGSVDDVYAFLNEAGDWSERLPHVARVVLTENEPGLQILEMDTLTKDGSQHTTKSVRVCFPGDRIVYKQITLPLLMSLHTGYWKLTETTGGVVATSQHTVIINPDTIATVLGEHATIEDARSFVRGALSTNSMATLTQAKLFAEQRG